VACSLSACAKKAETGAAKPSAPSAMEGKAMGKAGAAAGPKVVATESAPADPNAYYANTYEGGYGERERIAKLIDSGVLVDGETIQLAAFTRQYGQEFEIPTGKALSLTAQTENASVPAEGGETYLQVGIQAIRTEAPRRPPINLALVVDRSGSMRDQQKLEFAKRAAEEVVNRLEPSDRLALVTYDTTATVDVPSSPVRDKARFITAIRALQPGNSTDIHSALSQGYAQVARHLSGESINTVILVSDGLVTAGVSDDAAFRALAERYFNQGIQTTTIGVGLEFNEGLMSLVARCGKGSFHFVRDATTIPEVLERELGDLTHAVAKAVRLRVLLDPDVELVRVLGTGALSEEETTRVRADEKQIDRKVYEDLGIPANRGKADEPGVKMLIPHFYLGDSHVVLLLVRVPAGRRNQPIATAFLEYKDLVFSRNDSETASAAVDRCDKREEMVASTRQGVRKNRLGYETGEALLRAANLLAAGNASAATKAIDERMAVFGVAAQEWQDEDINRDHELLGRYQRVLASMGGRQVASQELGQYLAKSLSYSGQELTR
jgi:Ca-activated chloride channel homolog